MFFWSLHIKTDSFHFVRFFVFCFLLLVFEVILNLLGYFGGWFEFKNVLGSTNIIERVSFSILPSILTFEFDLILGLSLTVWGPNGLFLVSG